MEVKFNLREMSVNQERPFGLEIVMLQDSAGSHANLFLDQDDLSRLIDMLQEQAESFPDAMAAWMFKNEPRRDFQILAERDASAAERVR